MAKSIHGSVKVKATVKVNGKTVTKTKTKRF